MATEEPEAEQVHPRWCLPPDCDFFDDEQQGQHRGPLEVVYLPPNRRLDVEVSQKRGQEQMLTIRDWPLGRRHRPSVEIAIPLEMGRSLLWAALRAFALAEEPEEAALYVTDPAARGDGDD